MDRRKEFHISPQLLSACYQNTLSPEEKKQILNHLEIECPQCDQLINPPAKLELDETELSEIFFAIKRELKLPQQTEKNKSIATPTPENISTISQTKNPEIAELSAPNDEKIFTTNAPTSILKGLLAIAAGLLLLWKIPLSENFELKEVPNKTISADSTEYYQGLKGCQKAYLIAEVHRRAGNGKRQKLKVLPLKNGEDYLLGDIIIFKFIVAADGYVYLLRNDADGNLEQLFPFRDTPSKKFKAGSTYILEKQGVRMGYYLDESLLGYQKIWLVHSPIPQKFPRHIKELSNFQKKLLKCADQFDFFVLPTKK